nr:Ig-like domain-containing protein [Bacteroidota bacterium]
MKRFTIILLALISFSVLNAQYIYNDFDTNQNETFQGWPNIPVVSSNPDPSGINTSAGVAEWDRSGEQWAHVFCILDGKIDFTTGTTFHIKVYSPIACEVLFKLEDKANGSISTEISSNVPVANQWFELEYNFTSGQSGLYDKIVIFFDFATTTPNIYYFDDVEGPEYAGGVEPKPYLALDVQDNFENNGWGTIEEWSFQDPDLLPLAVVVDPVNASNHVADYNRSGSFEWTNAQFILDHRMDLTIRNSFDLKVYFPSSNDYTGLLTPTAAIKLQNSLLGPNAWMTQTEVLVTVTAFDQWVTLNFNFSAVADSMNYDQVVVQLGSEGHLVPAQFYFDDIMLNGSSGNGSLTFNPINGATDVDISVSPTLSFTVAVVNADGSEITNSDIADIVTFKETDAGGPDVPFNGMINAEKTLITIDPVSDLENGQAYYLALNDAVIRYQNADLIPGQNVTFTTVMAPKPYLALDVQD